MKRYSIYWTITVINDNGEACETTKSCDIIASNFKKAIEWLIDNKENFNVESVYSVYTYNDVNIVE